VTRAQPLLLLLAVGFLLGLTANVVRLAGAAGWPPLPLLFMSVAAAGALLLGIAAASGHAPTPGRRTAEYALASGFLSIALPNALFFLAVPHVGAGPVALCYAFPPLYTYVMAVLLRWERPAALRIGGVLAGIAGAAVLAAGRPALPGADPLWLLAPMAAAVALALGNIYRTLRWPPGAAAISLSPLMLTGGAVALLPAALLPGLSLWHAPAGAAQLLWLAVQTGIFTATYLLYFPLQKRAGPVYLSHIGPVGALAGTAFAVAVLGERADPALLLAAPLIVAGTLLATLGR
jgi:drug/metabolite transporter (DMT)-like permease